MPHNSSTILKATKLIIFPDSSHPKLSNEPSLTSNGVVVLDEEFFSRMVSVSASLSKLIIAFLEQFWMVDFEGKIVTSQKIAQDHS